MFGLFKKKHKKRKADWLVVGLGNPGEKYSGNRHNIGWMIVEKLCDKHKTELIPLSNIYRIGTLSFQGQTVAAAQPTTYMNKSGEAVRKLIKEFDVHIGNVIIVIDEYNFPLGKIHIKDIGGDGGHNGMADIINEVDSADFLRLRCGISNNFGQGGLVDYVLSNFEDNEIKQRDEMISHAVKAIEHIISLNNNSRAMSEINSGKIFNA